MGDLTFHSPGLKALFYSAVVLLKLRDFLAVILFRIKHIILQLYEKLKYFNDQLKASNLLLHVQHL